MRDVNFLIIRVYSVPSRKRRKTTAWQDGIFRMVQSVLPKAGRDRETGMVLRDISHI